MSLQIEIKVSMGFKADVKYYKLTYHILIKILMILLSDWYVSRYYFFILKLFNIYIYKLK